MDYSLITYDTRADMYKLIKTIYIDILIRMIGCMIYWTVGRYKSDYRLSCVTW